MTGSQDDEARRARGAWLVAPAGPVPVAPSAHGGTGRPIARGGVHAAHSGAGQWHPGPESNRRPSA